ncbi:hypothetical protein JRO89_XS10G0217200 [Xanthoceras sorbifolium]|uniref:Uncharacterized protein n=1 Tax=Xanthoceras sorbifolium TaxID=99658 RepID=A0ABQ8HJW5_9ROSI|nr:hypothetical protein JRO89_XS10G0217200 [Xanthoceras sorbifolium]
MDVVFKLPLDKKLSISQKPGSLAGYSGAHSHRFPSNLPWKELFSFLYSHDKSLEEAEVVNYFKSIISKTMRVYQKFYEEMKKVSEMIFELLAISLGLEDHLHYKKYFEDGKSLMRVNSYPPCKNAELSVLDPMPLSSILVTPLWHYLMENTKARAVVNTEKERRLLVFFVSTKEDKVVRPPQDLV